jgi:O-antigen/teichoic acid export membrane protein
MSRFNKNIKNAKIGLLLFIIGTLLSFFSRNFFLSHLGDQFNGLVSTITAIIGILGVAELGIATSISYKLYEPLFANNHKQVNNIVSIIGILYKKVGFLILVLGILISFLIPFYFDDKHFSYTSIYFIFYVYLLVSLLNYWFNYSKILLISDQKNYLLQGYIQGANYLKISTQILCLYFYNNFIVWIILELLFAIVLSIALYFLVKKQYPWLAIDKKLNIVESEEYQSIKIKTKQVFVHRLSGYMLTSTDSILIGLFESLSKVTFFLNYNILIQSVLLFLNTVFANITSSIGNLLIEKDTKKSIEVLKEILLIRFFIAIYASLMLYLCFDTIIILWLKESKYILESSTVLLIIANFFIMQIRTPVDSFINGFGLFEDIWAPFTEFLINLGLSILLGYYFGINGILFSTFVSMLLMVVIWKPFFLFKKGFNQSVKQYWLYFFKLSIPFPIFYFALNLINLNDSNKELNLLFKFFINATLYSSIILIPLLLYYYLFFPAFKVTLNRIKKSIFK